jgi:hypothetical protein
MTAGLVPGNAFDRGMAVGARSRRIASIRHDEIAVASVLITRRRRKSRAKDLS